jgi:Domain of unknown function (DUF4375)
MFASLLKFFGFSRRSRQQKSKKGIVDQQIAKSFEDFMNREIYQNLTTEIIDSISDDELPQVVFDSLILKLPQDDTKQYETVLNWTKPQQAIYLAWCLTAEVDNGGFNQYYFNSSGQFSELTPGALKLIGANNLAGLMIRANEIYATENEDITRHQDGTIEGFFKSYTNNPLNELDKEFYDLTKSEKLEQLQADFIRKNKADFIDP